MHKNNNLHPLKIAKMYKNNCLHPLKDVKMNLYAVYIR